MIYSNKRGISPIIATLLLISLSVVLAVIVFVWAKSFMSEKTTKFGAPIENSCEDIEFDVEVVSDEVANADYAYVVNKGNVPLFGIEIREKDEEEGKIVTEGTIKILEGGTLVSGKSKEIDLSSLDISFSAGDSLIVSPVIIGESSTYKKQYVCSEIIKEIKVVEGV